MKNKILFSVMLCLACTFSVNVSAQQDYYWYEGSKILLEKGNQEYIIYDDALLLQSDKEKIVEKGDVSYPEMANLKWGITKPNTVIEDLEHVFYRTPSYIGSEDDIVFVTHRFYVKLKDTEDLSVLLNMAEQYNAEIEQDVDLPLWYILTCGLPSVFNALELANIFCETKLFAASEPEFIGALYHNDVNAIDQATNHGFSQSTISKELFPTLAGLQRTVCSEYCGEDNRAYLVEAPSKTKYINEKLYVQYGGFYLREEGKRIFIYSYIQQKDLLLYDFTLQVGDSLPCLYTDWSIENKEYGNVVDYPTMTGYVNPILVVDLSEVTLLNGKKYKKWTFNNGMEYVENIGAYGRYKYAGDFFQLIADIPLPCHMSSRLICVSIDGMLLYQLDDAEMERLNTECLCDGYQSSYKSQWCDTWNVFVENGSVYPPHEETYRYQLAQDTVIGEHTYTAVVSKAINDALDAPHYVAAVRFTDDRKVYIYYDNAEYLLYDFNVQKGDELEVFAGINNYTTETKTYKCRVIGIEQYTCIGCPATITLHVQNNDLTQVYRETQWIEGVGDINGFLNGLNGYINIPGNAAEYLLCAYKGDELKYTGPLYEKYGCEYNEGDAINAVENVSPSIPSAQKIIKDGQVLILRNGKTYTMQGQEVK